MNYRLLQYSSSLQEPLTEEERRKQKERRRLDQEREERERMQVLVSNFTEGQLDRYEMFRRAAFPKASIKRVMQQITGERAPTLFIHWNIYCGIFRALRPLWTAKCPFTPLRFLNSRWQVEQTYDSPLM